MTDATRGTAPSSGGWKKNRLLRMVIMFFTLTACYIVPQLPGGMLRKFHPEHKDLWLWIFIPLGVVIVLSAYVWLVHWLEQRRPVAELRPSAAPGGLIMGAIIGFVILSAVLGILYLMGAAKFALPMPILFPSLATGVAVISGVAEECIFRGAVFRNLEDGFGSLVALIFSGALFGGLHIFNPNATLFSSIAIAVEAGLLLGAAFMATRTLWLPIGLHFGWNFTEGGFYSTAVSGGTSQGIVKTTLTGPNVLTGGAFGPEASWVTMCVCSVLTVIFLIIAARRGQWRPLQFHVRAP
jgi:membrane protease YdiL (CAAX protease family)